MVRAVSFGAQSLLHESRLYVFRIQHLAQTTAARAELRVPHVSFVKTDETWDHPRDYPETVQCQNARIKPGLTNRADTLPFRNKDAESP